MHVCIFRVGGGSIGDYLNLSEDLFCMVFSLLPASLLAFTCDKQQSRSTGWWNCDINDVENKINSIKLMRETTQAQIKVFCIYTASYKLWMWISLWRPLSISTLTFPQCCSLTLKLLVKLNLNAHKNTHTHIYSTIYTFVVIGKLQAANKENNLSFRGYPLPLTRMFPAEEVMGGWFI